MLTNKKISVLIILISFSFTSCWVTNIDWVINIEKSNENKQIEKISWEWKKGRSTWWNVDLNSNKDTSIYNWNTELPKWNPKNIK